MTIQMLLLLLSMKMEISEERVKEILSRELQVDIEKINENTSQESISEWDSLNHLKIISELEKEFGFKFTIREITDSVSFSNIMNIIKSK